MNLTQISITLGLFAVVTSVFALMKPAESTAALKRFPRSTSIGFLLMGLSTGWFAYNFNAENIADFEHIKKPMLIGFLVVGLGTMVYVRDFLAVRGFSVFLMLLAHLLVEKARGVESTGRLVPVLLAYLFVLVGIVWTIRPYLCRDLIIWATSNPMRFRVINGFRMILGGVLIVLGATVFRGYA